MVIGAAKQELPGGEEPNEPSGGAFFQQPLLVVVSLTTSQAVDTGSAFFKASRLK